MKKIARARVVEDKMVYDTYPIVYKSSNGEKTFLNVIYADHSELYILDSTYRGQEGIAYNPDEQIDMEKGNNSMKLHYNEIMV